MDLTEEQMHETFKDLSLTFMNRDYVLHTVMSKININNDSKLMPLTPLYLGVELE